jgi:VanZ family protein
LSSSEPWRNARPAPGLAALGSRIPRRSLFPDWIRDWWPALIWAVIIFTGSTNSFSSDTTSHYLVPFLRWLIPGVSQANLELIHHLIRKSAHICEYFIFCLLLYRGLRGIRRGWHLASALLAVVLAAAYSVLDEIHQSFIASRGASGWDSLLDTGSALIAMFAILLFYRLRRTTNR